MALRMTSRASNDRVNAERETPTCGPGKALTEARMSVGGWRGAD
jgi:hypothetical protein